MKPVAFYSLQRLEILISRELELKQLIFPLSIRCVVRQFNLLILLDYGAVEAVEATSDVQAIRRALAQVEQDGLYPWLSGRLRQIRCYWRQHGQQKPYKGCVFLFHSQSVQQSPEPVIEGNGSDVMMTAENRSHSAKPFSKRSIQGFEPFTSTPKPFFESACPEDVLSEGCPTPAPQTIGDGGLKSVPKVTERDEIQFRRVTTVPKKDKGFMSWPWIVGVGLTVFCAAVGAGRYVWNRPCVSSDCILLEEAQALHASLAFAENTSVEDVSSTYSTLLEMNHQLSQVPFWSPHYEDVRGLLSTYATHTHQVSEVLGAEEHAKVASAASQAPPYPLHDWQETQEHWQEAIQTLEPMSQNTIVSPLVKTQLQEYNAKLQTIEQKMQQEQMALKQVKSARKFARKAEMDSSNAVSSDQLRQVESYWQKALEHLESISEETMAYAEAEHLRVIYGPQLLAIRDRLALETVAEESYRQAIVAAKKSITFEQEQQWTLAVTHWQQALEHINQVPENTTYYGQMVPLVTSYKVALTNAQKHLQQAVTLQNAQAELMQRCSQVVEICETVTSGADAVLHVWLAMRPDHMVDGSGIASMERVAVSSDTSPAPVKSQKATVVLLEESVPSATESDRLNAWLNNISAMGKTMQISIHVHNPDGSVFGTYNPQRSSFVWTSTIPATSETETVDVTDTFTLLDQM